MFTPRNYTKLQKTILFSSFVCSGISLSALPALTASPTPGTVIENQASGSYVDEADNSTKTIVSDQVTVIVAEVAGITVTANGTTGTPNPGATIYSSFIITNVGNDPTQFFIPNLANLTGNATQASNIEITGYNLNGTTPVLIATPIVVPNGGGQTGSNGTVAGLLNGSNGTGIIQPGGSVTVRVPVKINTTAVNNDLIVVQLGDTPDSASTTTPKAQLQNQPFVVGSNDVYTVDNPDSLETSAGVPIDGDATFHRQEASVVQSSAAIAQAIVTGATCPLTNRINNPVSLSFVGAPMLVSGTANTSGAVYKFSNVATGIDAKVTLETLTLPTGGSVVWLLNNAGVGNLGASLRGTPSATFQIKVELVNAGTNTPIDPVDLTVTSFDIDGTPGNTVSDFAAFFNPDGYFSNSPTKLQSNLTPTGVEFSNSDTGVNDSTNSPNYAAGAVYLDTTSFTIQGGLRNASGAASRTVTFAVDVNQTANFNALNCNSFPRSTVSLFGSVFKDDNSNKLQDAPTEVKTDAGGLNAVLVDANNKVVATTPVASNGTYTFSTVPANANYTVQITTATATVNATPPAITLPTGWMSTGENLNGTIDGTVDSKLSFAVATDNIVNANFGIQQPVKGNNLSGTVFEDPNYGGGAGRKLSTTSTSPRSGATVELYKSDGTYISSTTTSSVAGSIGQYTFSNVAAGDYYVRVVNSTVTSSRTGYVSTLLPVQTFRVDDSTGTPADDINRVGGEKPSVADTGAAAAGAVLDTTNFTFTTGKGNATTGGQAQSIAPVKVGSSAVTGIDFGYNFDTIVNTNDSGQGSLRQFITNSNALSNTGLDQVPNPNPTSGTTAVNPAPGEETTIFMIPVAALTSNVGIITITTQLPAITDTFTTINGLTQTADIGNTNSGQQGSGGTVGTDGLTLSTVNKPEIQIVGNNTMNNGLTVQGANTTIRGIAINGFGNSVTNGNIVVDTNVSSTLIEKNFIGTTAASFSVPTSRTKGDNIILQSGANNGIVQNNLIGYAELFGVLGIASNQGWTIENNEIRDNSFNDPSKDGVSFESGSTNNLVRGNLIFSQGGNGVDSWNGGGTLTIENNTITGNGQGSTTGLGETPGVRLYGVGNKVYRNIINANYGAGVMVTAGSTNNTISQNSIYANGTIAAMNGGAASNQIGIDLLTTSDNQTQGTFNYVSANNGVVAGVANNSMDYPVIISSSLLGTSLKVSGFIGTSAAGNTAFANATLEFFISEGTNANQGEVIINDGKSKSHGEGKTYIGFCTADANGLFGTVSKPCLLSNVPAALTNPNNITATATDSAGNTSEFSSIPSASNPNVLLVKRITAINGDRIKNPNDNTPLNIFVDDTTSSKAAEDNNSNWVTNYLKGAINAGKVKPSDEIEYTIYFLSAGNASASGVRICDRLEPNQTFQPKGYGTGTGIQLQLGTSPVIDLTNINDASDRTQFIPAGATVPTNCNITGTNTDGTIIVDVTGAAGTGNPTLTALPEATGAGTPNDSYGFFRFIIKVNP